MHIWSGGDSELISSRGVGARIAHHTQQVVERSQLIAGGFPFGTQARSRNLARLSSFRPSYWHERLYRVPPSVIQRLDIIEIRLIGLSIESGFRSQGCRRGFRLRIKG